MPRTARTPRTHTRNHTKRHGKHHKRVHDYVKVYAPYLSLVIAIVASLFLSFFQPQSGHSLAYATEMSGGGLLSATNAHRAANGQPSLQLNSQLSQAAQAKANDMVARNYWSHNTPDGQEPWVFIQNAGYKYSKAGENLAYGFSTSGDTVTGWKNSAAHNANQLDGAYSDVGFGFANSSNFNGDGQETVVVAMYGKPQTLAAVSQPAAPVAAQPAKPAAPQAAAPTPAPQAETPAPTPTPSAPAPATPTPAPITTEQPVVATVAKSKPVAQVQTLTDGHMPWALGVIGTLLIGIALFKLLHHSLKLRHLFHDGQRFILHHPLLDSTLLGLTILGLTLIRTVGIIL